VVKKKLWQHPYFDEHLPQLPQVSFFQERLPVKPRHPQQMHLLSSAVSAVLYSSQSFSADLQGNPYQYS